MLRLFARMGGALCTHAVEVDSTAMVIHLVQEGMGLALLPWYAVAKALRAEVLVEISTDPIPPRYYSQLLCHRKRWCSPVMTAFIEAVKQA